MSLLDRLFKSNARRASVSSLAHAERSAPTVLGGSETLEVVGESHRQEVLWRIVGGRRIERVRHDVCATLQPEPTNVHDSNAVIVLIENELAGYLSRHGAALYGPGLTRLMTRTNTPVGLLGVIVGGGERADGRGFLGVFLDHDPADFGVTRQRAADIPGFRTGFSEAVATDLEDESYDLSWYTQLSPDVIRAIKQLRSWLETDPDPIDRHYMMNELEERLYKSRDAFESALERAVFRGGIAVNPTSGLELPSARGRRERVASPREAAELIAALPPGDRGLWSTAMYAGLRRGELLALRWEDVDLSVGVIRVERSYDPKEGVFVEPKTRAGRRSVPIASVLRGTLIEHRLASGRSEGLVFGATAERPFTPSNVRRRAPTAWRNANELAGDVRLGPLQPISLHECRHTFASLMIASGVNAKALASYMGHASVTITYDRYGHLMPGNESEAAALLDAYLENATSPASASA